MASIVLRRSRLSLHTESALELSAVLELAIIAILILINAFFAASEIAIVSMRRTRLMELADQGEKDARAALRLIDNPSRFLATIQVGVTLAGFFASAFGAITAVVLVEDLLASLPFAFIANYSAPIAFVMVTSTIAFLTLVLGELVPKSLAIQYAEDFTLAVARPVELISRLASPLVFILTGATNAILALLGVKQRARIPSISPDEIVSMVEAGEEEGIIKPTEADMIEGVFDLGELRAREIMVPRVDIVAIRSEATIDESLDLYVKSGYSRFPVYDESLDNIVGILYAKDVLGVFARRESVSNVSSLVRPAIFFPETKRIGELLKELQRERNHLAIVVDEFGGTAGIVTLEDILEEIVGEIRDEHEAEQPTMELISPTEALARGVTPLNEVNEALGLNLEAREFDTLGGLVASHLGRIPKPGDIVELPEATITVLTVSGLRVTRVRIQKKESETKAA